jgi:hypothetical protein
MNLRIVFAAAALAAALPALAADVGRPAVDAAFATSGTAFVTPDAAYPGSATAGVKTLAPASSTVAYDDIAYPAADAQTSSRVASSQQKQERVACRCPMCG